MRYSFTALAACMAVLAVGVVPALSTPVASEDTLEKRIVNIRCSGLLGTIPADCFPQGSTKTTSPFSGIGLQLRDALEKRLVAPNLRCSGLLGPIPEDCFPPGSIATVTTRPVPTSGLQLADRPVKRIVNHRCSGPLGTIPADCFQQSTQGVSPFSRIGLQLRDTHAKRIVNLICSGQLIGAIPESCHNFAPPPPPVHEHALRPVSLRRLAARALLELME